MKFRLTRIIDKKNIKEDSIDSLILSQSFESEKIDVSEILDFAFPSHKNDDPKSIDNIIFENSERVVVDPINDVVLDKIKETAVEPLNENTVNEEIATEEKNDDDITIRIMPSRSVAETSDEETLKSEEESEIVDVAENEVSEQTRETAETSEETGETEVRIGKVRGLSIFKDVAKRVINTVLTVLLAFILAVLINIYVCRPSKVSGESMVPTLIDNETVYISQLPYVFGDIKFGDIVVIDSNLTAKRTFMTSVVETLKYNILTKDLIDYEVDTFWIKRVIGVEGDVIEFRDNAIYRNGTKLYEEYINSQDIYTYPNGMTIEVQKGYIYVMGDNRNISRDSRQEGQIPVKNVVGKLVFH